MKVQEILDAVEQCPELGQFDLEILDKGYGTSQADCLNVDANTKVLYIITGG